MTNSEQIAEIAKREAEAEQRAMGKRIARRVLDMAIKPNSTLGSLRAAFEYSDDNVKVADYLNEFRLSDFFSTRGSDLGVANAERVTGEFKENIRQVILKVLREASEPLSKSAILDRLDSFEHIEVVRSKWSSIAKTMKDDGLLELAGGQTAGARYKPASGH